MKVPPVMWSVAAEEQRRAYWQFAQEHIAPRAGDFERAQAVPEDTIALLAQRGYLGLLVPEQYGGSAGDLLQFGFLNEALGAACSSVRTLLTVHSMVCQALVRWGKEEQKNQFLPALAQGLCIGAFALTEPQAGSDARGIETVATSVPGGWKLRGRKRWISYGQRADLFLVLAVVDSANSDSSKRQALALLVPGNTPGIKRRPLNDLLGTKASLLAELEFDDCFVPEQNVLSRPGFGLAVCSASLEIGRLSVAWGSVGVIQACLEASAAYATERRQFGAPLTSHQLIQAKITDMMVAARSVRLLCVQASMARQEQRPNCVLDILMAKYQAARLAQEVATQAVQIHGANGCSDDYPVARYYRDAKTLEIIEGSSEIMQGLIAQQVRMTLNK